MLRHELMYDIIRTLTGNVPSEVERGLWALNEGEYTRQGADLTVTLRPEKNGVWAGDSAIGIRFTMTSETPRVSVTHNVVGTDTLFTATRLLLAKVSEHLRLEQFAKFADKGNRLEILKKSLVLGEEK